MNRIRMFALKNFQGSHGEGTLRLDQFFFTNEDGMARYMGAGLAVDMPTFEAEILPALKSAGKRGKVRLGKIARADEASAEAAKIIAKQIPAPPSKRPSKKTAKRAAAKRTAKKKVGTKRAPTKKKKTTGKG